MEKKIVSVKTKLDYHFKFNIIPAGTPGIKEYSNWNWYHLKKLIMSNTDEYIRANTEWFDFKEESYEFKFKPFSELQDSLCFNKDLMIYELNRLADWCDANNEKNKSVLYYMIYYNTNNNELQQSSYSYLYNPGIKLNSLGSAELFISELNKPENLDYKNYFVGLLRKPRL